MGYMTIILTEDIENLGKAGDVVRVRAGYGRNYLIPKGLALQATERNRKRLEHERQVIARRREKMIKTVEEMKARLEELTVTIPKKAGEGEKLYGSVTNKEIAQALASQGIEMDRKAIHIEEPIKSLGIHTVTVKLPHSLTASLKVWVVPEEEK